MLAEIIAVGSEMLTPYRQDTNSLTLTAERAPTTAPRAMSSTSRHKN